MAKNKKEEEVIVDVEQAYTKAERYFEENKNSLTIIAAAIILIVGGYFGYKKLYVQPMQQEAVEQMWKAEQYFEQDSLRLAINGDGQYFGFMDIIDQYGPTKAANLAHYYIGISYLRLGDFEGAIEYLSAFDASDEMIDPIATGAIGDAHSEMGNIGEAVSFYLKAAEQGENQFTGPVYLMKAGLAYEELGDYEKAKEVYLRLKNTYPNTSEGRDAAKYIARAEALAG